MTTYLALAVLLALPTASAYAAGGVAAKKGAAQPIQLWRHDLASATRYLPEEERLAAYQALKTAVTVHDGQCRRDGQPFVTHPVAVAKLVAEWGMDSQCVQAALLHDAVEDTPLTFAEVECDFGADVRSLVQGVTRVSKLDSSKLEEDAQALLAVEGKEGDVLRLLHSCAGDWRVAVLKLADRLHNMRTLGAMLPAKRAKKAKETQAVFVPLAHYLGAHDVAYELARLSARYRADDQPSHKKLAARLSSMLYCVSSQRVSSAVARAVASGALPAPATPLEGFAKGSARAWQFPGGVFGGNPSSDRSERNLLQLIEQLDHKASSSEQRQEDLHESLYSLYTRLRPLQERMSRHQAVLMSEGWERHQA